MCLLSLIGKIVFVCYCYSWFLFLFMYLLRIPYPLDSNTAIVGENIHEGE